MSNLPSSTIIKSLVPACFASKRARSMLKPPLPPPIIRKLKRLVRPPRRLGRCPMDIDSPPLPARMEIDDPWSPNLITLDTNWVNDHMGGLTPIDVRLSKELDNMDAEMGEAAPLSPQRDLMTVVEAITLPSEDLEMEEAGPSSSQDPPPKVEKAGPSPPVPFDAGSSKATRVIAVPGTRWSRRGHTIKRPDSPRPQ
ncbi:unnamed protein product [Umbelopsis ramanniana]